MASGLLDRAESLLVKLVDNKKYSDLAIKKLIEIYQKEKEWAKGLLMADSLELRSVQPYFPVLAQFCCEQAEIGMKKREFWEAKKEIKKALDYDKKCARALLLLSDINAELGEFSEALTALRRLSELEVGYLGEIGLRVRHFVDAGFTLSIAIKFIKKLYQDSELLSLSLVLADLYSRDGALDESIALLERQLVKHPSIYGLVKMLDFYQRAVVSDKSVSGTESKLIDSLVSVCDQLGRDMAGYKCSCCGFESKSLYWLCPSCQEWSSSTSMLDYESNITHYSVISNRKAS
jgi:lipopolysaccharide biosynthesis regulator YciM